MWAPRAPSPGWERAGVRGKRGNRRSRGITDTISSVFAFSPFRAFAIKLLRVDIMSAEQNIQTTPVGAVMVCGGGIAGIQSALDLANSGYKVYLLDKSATIGGKMAQLDKTFPTGDCATCIVSPKLVEAARNLNIEIITQAQIQDLQREAGGFQGQAPAERPIYRYCKMQLLRRLRESVPGARAGRFQPGPRDHDGLFIK